MTQHTTGACFCLCQEGAAAAAETDEAGYTKLRDANVGAETVPPEYETPVWPPAYTRHPSHNEYVDSNY